MSVRQAALVSQSGALIGARHVRCWASVRQMANKQAPQFTHNKWWTPDTVAVVTGANKGIGKEIARILAGQQLTVIATARNDDLGKAAVADISTVADPQSKVVYHRLDVNDPSSHQEFKEWLQKEYGGLSILVNNAGMAYKGDTFGPDELRTTLATNYYGTVDLTETLLPLIKDKEGRVVCVSSRAGLSTILRSDTLKQRFLNAESRQDIDALLSEFITLVEKRDDGALAQSGWPRSMYGVSKLALTSYCMTLAKKVASAGVAVAACCPGWCVTDMSSQQGNKTAAEGADTPVWLALQHPDELLAVTGKLWGERSAVRP